MAEKNTAKPDPSDSKHLGRDLGSCKTCNQLIGLVPSTSPDVCGLVVDEHVHDVGAFTDSEGPHDKLVQSSTPKTPKGRTPVQSSTPKGTPKRPKAICNRCKGERSLTVDGVFHKHHFKFEERLPRPEPACKGSLESPIKTFHGKTWGSCKECQEKLKLIDGNPKVVEEHFWGLMCPGSRKNPVDVEEKPDPLVEDPDDVADVVGAMDKLDAKLEPKPSPK